MTQETKLTEPVQVGLWYETESLAIIKIDKQSGLTAFPYQFDSNISVPYDENGKAFANHELKLNLIRCLGADPFKQVQPDDDKTLALDHIDKVCGELGINLHEARKRLYQEKPTQFERIFTEVLGGLCANPETRGRADCFSAVRIAVDITQEAIKQLKEIEGA